MVIVILLLLLHAIFRVKAVVNTVCSKSSMFSGLFSLAIFLGLGTGFRQFNCAGEALEMFWNSIIEAGVLRVDGCLVGSSVLLC